MLSMISRHRNMEIVLTIILRSSADTAEKKLRMKLDLYILPTVTLLYRKIQGCLSCQGLIVWASVLLYRPL